MNCSGGRPACRILGPAQAGAVLVAAALLLIGTALDAREQYPGPEDVYDYAARQRLIASSRESKDYASTLYHAAWLYWLAPRRQSAAAEAVLQDREVVQAARRARPDDPAAIVLAALEARRSWCNVCLSGRVSSQAALREAHITGLIERAQEVQRRLGRTDPLVRMALADLYLTLDQLISLRAGVVGVQERTQVLRKAVAAAESASQSLPQAPGAYRMLTAARARLADLSNDPGERDLAISACAHALAADPDDPELCETMWGLHLRAGHWIEARRWERRCADDPS